LFDLAWSICVGLTPEVVPDVFLAPGLFVGQPGRVGCVSREEVFAFGVVDSSGVLRRSRRRWVGPMSARRLKFEGAQSDACVEGFIPGFDPGVDDGFGGILLCAFVNIAGGKDHLGNDEFHRVVPIFELFDLGLINIP